MRLLSFLLLVALILSLGGCLSQQARSEQLKAATTIIPLGEFVSAVGGERVKVAVMVPPGGEPHTFEPSPFQMKQVEDADIYVENGAGLESWLDKIIQVNPHMLILDASRGVDLIKGSDQESPGAIHGVDPHIWLSPRNAMIMVRNICEGLIQVDPAGRDYYIKNRDDYLQRLKGLDEYLNSVFEKNERKKFIVLHPAWSYFARDYGLEEIAIEVEEKEPGPKYLTKVVDLARADNITTIFVEPQFNPKLAEVIAKEINGTVVALDPLAENYLENMKQTGEKISESLRQ